MEANEAGSPANQWLCHTDEGAVVLQRKGNRVLVVEGVPAGLDAAKVAASLWP